MTSLPLTDVFQGLREECGKLQKRVLDLEDQNRQLRDMFHQRLKFSSDSLLQVRSVVTLALVCCCRCVQ